MLIHRKDSVDMDDDILDASFRKALKLLRGALAPFVFHRVKKRLGDDWWAKGVEPLLEPVDRKWARSHKGPKEEWFVTRDALFYLKYIDHGWVWRELFRSDFDDGLAKAYVLELRRNRNITEHDPILRPLTEKQLERAVDTAALLLDAFGLAAASQRLRDLLAKKSVVDNKEPATEQSKEIPQPTKRVPVFSPTPGKLPLKGPILPAKVSVNDVTEAVRFFDSRYSEMDKALWYLSKISRTGLLQQRGSEALQTLVWKLKSWWGVQGVTERIKVAADRALAEETWTESMFDATPLFTSASEAFAFERVSDLVSRLQALGGTTRQEYSLASKVLHWLVPWRVPVYDSLVRKSLAIPPSWDAPRAYSELIRKEYDLVRHLPTIDSSWLGTVEPKSPFRAIDKYLWWLAGGPNQKAVIVRNPWKGLRELGA